MVPEGIASEQPLFRAQALQASRVGWVGSASIAQPVGSWTLVWAVVCVLASVVLFGSVATYTKKVPAVGYLTSGDGQSQVQAHLSGVVSNVWISLGAAVEKGQRLGEIDSDQVTSFGPTQANVVEIVKRRQLELIRDKARAKDRLKFELEQLRGKQRKVEHEVVSLEKQGALQAERLQLAKQLLGRQEELVRAGFLSSAALLDRRSSILADQIQGEAIDRAVFAARRDLGILEAEIQKAHSTYAREVSDYQSAVLSHEQELLNIEAKRRQLLLSPMAGRVVAINTEPGRTVQTGQTLFVVQPTHTALSAEIYISSRAIGEISRGTRVYLKLPAFPVRKFGILAATVASVSGSSTRGSELRHPQSEDGYFVVKVLVDDASAIPSEVREKLRTGMQVDAAIELETKSVLMWLFEPVSVALRVMFAGKQ